MSADVAAERAHSFPVLVDGEPCSAVPSDDRGLHYGDGVFETLTARNAEPRFFELHWARLREGCSRLSLEPPPRAVVEAELRAAGGGAPKAIVKLIVTRGSATQRGYASSAQAKPRRIVAGYPWVVDEAAAASGVAACVAAQAIPDSPQLAGIKHLNRLEQVLAARTLEGQDAREALLRGVDGRIVGGISTNLFLVHEDRLSTPCVRRAGIAGVLRSVVLREAMQLGLRTSVRDLTPIDLAKADEIFVTNVRLGVQPIVALGAWRVPQPGPVTRRLQVHVAGLDA